jgi:hypothetical protein
MQHFYVLIEYHIRADAIIIRRKVRLSADAFGSVRLFLEVYMKKLVLGSLFCAAAVLSRCPSAHAFVIFRPLNCALEPTASSCGDCCGANLDHFMTSCQSGGISFDSCFTIGYPAYQQCIAACDEKFYTGIDEESAEAEPIAAD